MAVKSKLNGKQPRLWLGDKPTRQVKTNVVYQGDNLPLLKELEPNKIDLIYIDPPFCSQAVYKSKAWGKKVVGFQDQWGGASTLISTGYLHDLNNSTGF